MASEKGVQGYGRKAIEKEKRQHDDTRMNKLPNEVNPKSYKRRRLISFLGLDNIRHSISSVRNSHLIPLPSFGHERSKSSAVASTAQQIAPPKNGRDFHTPSIEKGPKM